MWAIHCDYCKYPPMKTKEPRKQPFEYCHICGSLVYRTKIDEERKDRIQSKQNINENG